MADADKNGTKEPVLHWEDMQDEWVKCPVCDARLKSENVEDHVSRVHNEKLKVEGKPKEKKFPHALLILVVVCILVIASTGFVFYMNEMKDDDTNTISGNDDYQQDTSDDQDSGNNWLNTYQPKYDLGAGQEDWWIDNPEIHPVSGSSVDHLRWVLDSLENKPVVIFAHSDDCAPCIQQQKDIEPIIDEYGAEVAYYDLLTDGTEPKAFEAYEAYDPNGDPPYIPLTAMVTLVEDNNGDVRITWHSTEGATGGEWIRDYMKDAIYYHENNIQGWSGV